MRKEDRTTVESSGKAYSRRQFLKLAGAAGAVAGLGAGLGGLVTACGGASTTTSAAASTAASGPASTGGVATTAGSTGTSASAAGETGGEIKVGFVSAITGPIAAFGGPDKYLTDRWKEAIGDGLVCGDGKKHPVTILLQDCQSNSNRAAQVAGDLIQNSKVDVLTAGCTGETTIPVADQAEAFGVPCFTTDTIWQAWFNSRKGDPKVGFKWTYHAHFATDDSFTMYFAMWDKVPNNKTYGALWPNDADGQTYRNMWPKAIAEHGWKLIDGGAFPDGLEDFTSIVDTFKRGGAEVCAGLMAPPDFETFWKQAHQQSYMPKVCSIGKALNFPAAVNALGDIAIGLTGPIYWNPSFPYKSSLSGETCRQLADDFESKSGQEWTQALGHHILFEVVADTFKRAKDPADKQAVVDALKVTKIQTVQGNLDYSAPVQAGTVHPNINCCRTPLVGGQWVKGTKWPYDVAIVSNKGFEDIAVQAQMMTLSA